MVQTHSLSQGSLDDKLRQQFLDSYALDAEEFLDRCTEKVWEGDSEFGHDSDSIDELVVTFEVAWVEQAKVPPIPEAVDAALLPAALVMMEEFGDPLDSRQSGLQQKTFLRRTVVPTYFDTVIEMFYLNVKDGLSPITSLGFSEGGAQGTPVY